MEENKEKNTNCCEGNCEQKGGCGHCEKKCCHNWKKCYMIKKIVWIILIIAAFCLGSQWGEMKAKTYNTQFNRGGMMGWGYNQPQNARTETSTDSVTIKVIDPNAETPKQ